MRYKYARKKDLLRIIAERHLDTDSKVPREVLASLVKEKAFKLAELGDNYHATLLLVAAVNGFNKPAPQLQKAA